MTPYRVLVDMNGNNGVLSSMLSVDKKSGDRRIFIVNKMADGIKDDGVTSPKFIAHMQTGKRNSSIMASYIIRKNDDRSYSINRLYFGTGGSSAIELSVNGVEYTQSDCLRAAMNNYCASCRYKILQDL